MIRQDGAAGRAVNVTLGCPSCARRCLRHDASTSPRGIADPSSLVEAVKLAAGWPREESDKEKDKGRKRAGATNLIDSETADSEEWPRQNGKRHRRTSQRTARPRLSHPRDVRGRDSAARHRGQVDSRRNVSLRDSLPGSNREDLDLQRPHQLQPRLGSHEPTRRRAAAAQA